MEVNTIHNEDCVETMKRMDDKSIDLCLTDPPYGIGLEYDTYVDSPDNWAALMLRVMPHILRVSKMVIMPSCKIQRMQWIYDKFPPDWLICWYKGSPGHASYIGFNDWEPHLVYGRRVEQLFMHDYFQTRSSPKKGKHNHPCPKPVEWSDWLISKVAGEDTITVYDPFGGSGTVGVSCKRLGHNYILSDISEEYCKIASDRITKAKRCGVLNDIW